MYNYTICPYWSKAIAHLEQQEPTFCVVGKRCGQEGFVKYLKDHFTEEHGLTLVQMDAGNQHFFTEGPEGLTVDIDNILRFFTNKIPDAATVPAQENATDSLGAILNHFNILLAITFSNRDHFERHFQLLNFFHKLYEFHADFQILVIDEFDMYYYGQERSEDFSVWHFQYERMKHIDERKLITLYAQMGAEAPDAYAKAVYMLSGGHLGLIVEAGIALASGDVSMEHVNWQEQLRGILEEAEPSRYIQAQIGLMDHEALGALEAYQKPSKSLELRSPQLRQFFRLGVLLKTNLYHAQVCKGEIHQEILQAHQPPQASKKIFISHAHQDLEIAEALVKLLMSAFAMPQEDIVCTSLNGHGVPVGVDIEDWLKTKLKKADLVVGLLTKASLESAYVLFELGSTLWGGDRDIFPVMLEKDIDSGRLGPIKNKSMLKVTGEADWMQLVTEIKNTLGLTPKPLSQYSEWIERLASIQKMREALS